MLWGDRAKGSCCFGQDNCDNKKFQCRWLNTTQVYFSLVFLTDVGQVVFEETFAIGEN